MCSKTSAYKYASLIFCVPCACVCVCVCVRALATRCQGMCCCVEIKYDDDWGTVCDDNFKKKSAEVVCRQLKCSGGEVVRSFGGGEGTIWMDKVNCAGDEKALSKCEFRGWGKHDCSHSHDVAVCCNDNCVAILKAKGEP